MIAKEAKGFLYCVSLLEVTGTRSEITTDIGAMIKIVREETNISCAIGFGISTPEQAAKMALVSDGVIVGFAIVKLCGKYGKDCVEYVAEYVKGMKEVMRGGGNLNFSTNNDQKLNNFRVCFKNYLLRLNVYL